MDEQGNLRVIVLDPEPVRYGWRAPSLSRRGGVRLHPIRDGVLRLPEERTLQMRDQCGNKLRDVTDPRTGFCSGVISPLIGGQVNKGTSGSATVEIKRALVIREGAVYLDEEGRVIRTEAMGDSPLPTCKRNRGASNVPQTKKEPRNVALRAASGRPVDPRTVPGGTGANGEITREDVRAYLRALSKGRPHKETPDLLRMARKALEAKRAEAARKMYK